MTARTAIAALAAFAACCRAAAAQDAPVARVGTNTLSRAEADARADVLIEKARRTEHLTFPPEMLEETRAYYRVQAADLWIATRILADEAARQGFGAVDSEISARIGKMDKILRKKRGITAETFIETSPLGREREMKDIAEAIAIDKLLAKEVAPAIKISRDEIASELEAARRPRARGGAVRAAGFTERDAENAVRKRKFPNAFRAYYAKLAAKADIDKPQPPERLQKKSREERKKK